MQPLLTALITSAAVQNSSLPSLALKTSDPAETRQTLSPGWVAVRHA